ncbi:rhomboid family intramembrane serine protease [Lachnospiraceae bacterium OttesenSCG-928-D06]|nr:rhomboid family intramembrane serine protease [Lachnospiraceae bacterium OttesenSCG-928-D06]
MKSITRKIWASPFVSIILVVINVIVFLLCNLIGDILYYGGRLGVAEILYHREYGRIIWSMFLHSDINHLFNNMLILFFLGAMIEKEIGHIQFGFFYFLSGIAGNILSLLAKILENDWSVSIGASGAVFGLDGIVLSLVLFSDRKLETVTPIRVVLMIALSLYNGFTGDNIDNAAHIGGLIAGFLLGTVMCVIERRKKRKQHF